MAYKDKDKQKEAQRERTGRYRQKQKGVTSEGVTQGVTSDDSLEQPSPLEVVDSFASGDTITDACDTVHKIDFEGRCRDRRLLKSWAEGRGSAYQCQFARLARQYSAIKGYVDGSAKLDGYLGYEQRQAVQEAL